MEDIYIRSFNELSNIELYEILKLRNEVFIVEQNCPYTDIDGLDKDATHLYIKEIDKMVAYCRVLPKGTVFNEIAIGRVVTDIYYRNKGYARALVQKAIEYILHEKKETEISISAQTYLVEFYESLGFSKTSDMYLEDNIPHCDMRYTSS